MPLCGGAEALRRWLFPEIFDIVSLESVANFPFKKGSRIFKQRAPNNKKTPWGVFFILCPLHKPNFVPRLGRDDDHFSSPAITNRIMPFD